MEAAEIFNFNLTIVCPDEYKPIDIELNSNVELTNSIDSGLKEADLVTTDVWVSMGDEKDSKRRLSSFLNYQISPTVMNKAKSDAIFLHCLPAIRGQEISADMLDDPRSKVWEQAENRLHAQKSLLLALL
jgi:ornithine carbamoyltransferase